MFIVPTPPINVFDWSVRVQFGAAEHVLRYLYADRRAKYTLDVHTIDGQALILGRTITVGFDLFDRIPNPPEGRLYLVNSDGSFEPPTMGDFEERSRIYWVPPGELLSFEVVDG